MLTFLIFISGYDCRKPVIASVSLFRCLLVHVTIDLRNHFGFGFTRLNENVSELCLVLM